MRASARSARAHLAHASRAVDVAVSIYFEDTDEHVWFAPYLVEKIDPAAAWPRSLAASGVTAQR